MVASADGFVTIVGDNMKNEKKKRKKRT